MRSGKVKYPCRQTCPAHCFAGIKSVFLILALLLAIGWAVPVRAAGKLSLVEDYAGLLEEEEEQELRTKLEEISSRQGMDVVVVTVDSLKERTATEAADDFYDYNGYGQGSTKDGILLLIAMGDRSWAISTTGEAISVFTDAGQEYMVEQFLPYLSDGAYLEAFVKFADLCDSFITQAKEAQPYDVGNMPKESVGVEWIAISLVIGAILAFLITGAMRMQLRSVRRQAEAGYYHKDGIHLTRRNDWYLYRNVQRHAKPKDNGGAGGGSSTHVGSSGTTHGGSSGHF